MRVPVGWLRRHLERNGRQGDHHADKGRDQTQQDVALSIIIAYHVLGGSYVMLRSGSNHGGGLLSTMLMPNEDPRGSRSAGRYSATSKLQFTPAIRRSQAAKCARDVQFRAGACGARLLHHLVICWFFVKLLPVRRIDLDLTPRYDTHIAGPLARDRHRAPRGAFRSSEAVRKGWFGGTSSLQESVFWPVAATFVAATGQRWAAPLALPAFQTDSQAIRPAPPAMDMGLPIMNGWQATHRIKSSPAPRAGVRQEKEI